MVTHEGKTRFAEKIDGLSGTLDLLRSWDAGSVANAIGHGRHRRAVAIGSGGSAVVATFFARCRETLLCRETSVLTPLAFSVGNIDLSEVDVWLFSASGDNGDVRAAVAAARTRGAASIELLTRDADGRAARELASLPQGRVHLFPVADAKDGFLATHSLAGSLGALLLGCDAASTDPVGARLLDEFIKRVNQETGPDARRRVISELACMRADDVLIVIADPQLSTVAELIETSAWEASFCPVQVTDMRNLAHGRHSWLHHRGGNTVLLALTGVETSELWRRIQERLPQDIRYLVRDHGDCGRFHNAVGAITALGLVEAMGMAVGIDPGKPGIAEFGRELYEDEGLLELVGTLGPAVIHKRSAVLGRDDPDRSEECLRQLEQDRLAAIDGATIGGIVLDYDGTIVASDRRLEQPDQSIVDELVRLYEAGVRIAIATGRGGSAAEMLRFVLPQKMHADVAVGYYNGAYVRSLAVDIRREPPEVDPAIAAVADWIRGGTHLVDPDGLRDSGVQASVRTVALLDLDSFLTDLGKHEEIASGRLRAVRSGHSVDIVSSVTTKLAVVEWVCLGLAADHVVLRLGDSGEAGGNDNELLRGSYGLSVGRVCGHRDGVWAPFGASPSGPTALSRILAAIRPDASGTIRLKTTDMLLNNKE